MPVTMQGHFDAADWNGRGGRQLRSAGVTGFDSLPQHATGWVLVDVPAERGGSPGGAVSDGGARAASSAAAVRRGRRADAFGALRRRTAPRVGPGREPSAGVAAHGHRAAGRKRAAMAEGIGAGRRVGGVGGARRGGASSPSGSGSGARSRRTTAT